MIRDVYATLITYGLLLPARAYLCLRGFGGFGGYLPSPLGKVDAGCLYVLSVRVYQSQGRPDSSLSSLSEIRQLPVKGMTALC